MKRISLLISAALFILAGCQQETIEPAAFKDGAVRITVSIDDAAQTKADDFSSISKLYFEVYDANDARVLPEGAAAFPSDDAVNTVAVSDEGKAVIENIHLLKNKNYTFVFWAMSDGAPYTWENLKEISMNYGEGNVVRDAFAGSVEVSTSSAIDVDVTLRRPFAQLNVGNTQSEMVKSGDYSYVKTVLGTTENLYRYLGSSITVKGAATKFDASTMTASEAADVTFECGTILDEALTAGDPVADYAHMSMNYIILPGKTSEGGVADIISVFSISEVPGETPSGEIEYSHNLANVPLQANHRTNILGSIFTFGRNLTVSLESWAGSDNHEIWDGSMTAVTPVDGVYTVTTASELAWIADQVNTGANDFEGETVRLADDIDLLGYEWIPIGTEENPFKGTFDGEMPALVRTAATESFTVSNLTVTGNQTYSGFFGYTDGATLKNINFVNANIISEGDTDTYAGVLVAYATNTAISNASVESSSVTGPNNVGGIAGYSDVAPTGCSVGDDVEVTVDQTDVDSPVAPDAGLVVGSGSTPDSSNSADDAKLYQYLADGAALNLLTKEYEITGNIGLEWFASQVNSGVSFLNKTVALVTDVDLESEEWTPIGNSTNKFQGKFDGKEHTIGNLVINAAGKNDIGLFGFTTDGEICNLTVHNAKVTGRLNVAVVTGTPYTSKYTNISVTGHVEVNGMSYVGAVGGKNAYASWKDVTIDVDETSYVYANSIENETAYRSYVGGACGFNGEGSHSFTDITSNIDVRGTTCDVGGLFGIAHYGNSFINCSCSADVEITSGPEAGDCEEIGGIAGVWYNQTGYTVTFENCSFTGNLKTNITDGVDLTDNSITGNAYSTTGTGSLIIK